MFRMLQDCLLTCTFLFTFVIVILELQKQNSKQDLKVAPNFTQMNIINNISKDPAGSFKFHTFITSPPDYQCKYYPKGDSYFKLGEEIQKLFNGDKEKTLEYLYKEFSLNREHTLHTMESLITLEQLLVSFDIYIRCKIYYQPAHFIQMQNIAAWPAIMEQIKQKYKLPTYYSEVFHYDHRLKMARPKVKEYVRQRDIIDLGTWCGDSMIVLSQYTDKMVYSYEYSPANLKLAQETLKNYIPEGKAQLFHKGIADVRKTIKSQHHEDNGATFVKEGTVGEEIELTTIDYEANKYNMKVGMIKGDVEGYELKALIGAQEVLKRDRPAVTLALYHNIEEFFGVPKMLREMNYEVEFYFNSAVNPRDISEFIIFAYPSELL